MNLSKSQITMMQRLERHGGSLNLKGNGRSGGALTRRGLVKIKQGYFVLTAKGRKFIEKNLHD